MNWLQRLTARPRGAAAAPLARQLVGYRPYVSPWPGPGRRLSEAQAQANLDHLLARRAARIAQVTELLRGAEIDLRAGLAAPDPLPTLRALDAWAHAQWPALLTPALARPQAWLASQRQGDELVFSMLLDLAIALGQAVVERRPAFAWALDLDPYNAEMTSYRRPVLQIPAGGPRPAPVVLDAEAIVCGRFQQAKSPTFGLVGELTRAFGDALSGAHEAHGQAPHAGR